MTSKHDNDEALVAWHKDLFSKRSWAVPDREIDGRHGVGLGGSVFDMTACHLASTRECRVLEQSGDECDSLDCVSDASLQN